jgi:hypothetical protein
MNMRMCERMNVDLLVVFVVDVVERESHDWQVQ